LKELRAKLGLELSVRGMSAIAYEHKLPATQLTPAQAQMLHTEIVRHLDRPNDACSVSTAEPTENSNLATEFDGRRQG
jgi:hypothetical protein